METAARASYFALLFTSCILLPLASTNNVIQLYGSYPDRHGTSRSASLVDSVLRGIEFFEHFVNDKGGITVQGVTYSINFTTKVSPTSDVKVQVRPCVNRFVRQILDGFFRS